MSEQKHTPGPWKSKNKSVYIDPKVEANPFNQWIAECRNTEDAELIARAPELLQQVAELTKENEKLQLENAWENSEQLQEIKALTEQVERLKAENIGKWSVAKWGNSDVLMYDGVISSLTIEEICSGLNKLNRLREERKELVEALREFCQAVRKSDEKYPDWVGTSEVYGALFKSESLLSKFEAPKD